MEREEIEEMEMKKGGGRSRGRTRKSMEEMKMEDKGKGGSRWEGGTGRTVQRGGGRENSERTGK